MRVPSAERHAPHPSGPHYSPKGAAPFFLNFTLVLLGLTVLQALVFFTPLVAFSELGRFCRLALTLRPRYSRK
jgi:hypothetical protein